MKYSSLLTIARIIAYLFLGYFIYLMALITLQYLPIKFDVAFLKVKEIEIKLTHYQWSFFVHVYSSILVLIAGSFQFSAWIRTNYSALHRLFGKFYVLVILLLASPSGLIMGVYANGGSWSKLSFCLQAILWFAFTFIAFRSALKRNWEAHRKFMIRSFALSLSAISLRLIKWGITYFFELPPMDTYKIVAWAGWVVNLVLVEVYLYMRQNQSKNNLV